MVIPPKGLFDQHPQEASGGLENCFLTRMAFRVPVLTREDDSACQGCHMFLMFYVGWPIAWPVSPLLPWRRSNFLKLRLGPPVERLE